MISAEVIIFPYQQAVTVQMTVCFYLPITISVSPGITLFSLYMITDAYNITTTLGLLELHFW